MQVYDYAVVVMNQTDETKDLHTQSDHYNHKHYKRYQVDANDGHGPSS
jgi:hypothetical protein